MSREGVKCMHCGATAVPAERFCESCGSILRAVRRAALPGPATSLEVPCADCGNETYVDDYCAACGNRRAEHPRDQVDLDGIVLITDRGLAHPRNEDAAAAGIVAGEPGEPPHAMAVAVCDGVSTSADAQAAAVSASMAGVDAMLRALAASRKPRSAVLAGLTDAAMAAVTAGLDSLDLSMAPSCTYAAAVIVPTPGGTAEIAVGNVGDSRVYWLPDPPAAAQCLTVDDSLAQELITAGVPAESEAVQAGEHTLTRWLGADAEPTPWSESSVRTITAERGFLVMCTDGLWNYLPEAEDIAQVCAGSDATAAARALVDHALRAGGQDNITVAVIPIGGIHEYG
jgi:serine/threonine protein phosphatase PrpC